MKAQKGFTLIELMIVVAIIGILAAIAIPSYNNYIKTTKVRAHMDNLDTAVRLVKNECAKVNAGGATTDIIALLNEGSKKAVGDAGSAAFINAGAGAGQVQLTDSTGNDLVDSGDTFTVSITTAAAGTAAGDYPGAALPGAISVVCD